MAYIRLTIVKPLHGHDALVEELIRRVTGLAAQQDGCLESWVLKPHDDSGEIARIAIWKDVHAADRAASDPSIMAARSELNQWLEPSVHVERGFFSD